MRINKQVTIIRSTGPVETTVGSEVVLMTLESGECLGLGETGSDVWRLLEKPTHLDPIIASLSQTYQAPPGVIEHDVIDLLEQVLDRGLIELQS
jgi:hypothetical protein